MANWQSLRDPFCSGGLIVSGRSLGSDFRGYANQEAHYTDLKQVPLRQTHRQERLRCNVKVKQASTYQCDPTDVVGDSSNQPQTCDVVHVETLLRCTERTGGVDF